MLNVIKKVLFITAICLVQQSFAQEKHHFGVGTGTYLFNHTRGLEFIDQMAFDMNNRMINTYITPQTSLPISFWLAYQHDLTPKLAFDVKFGYEYINKVMILHNTDPGQQQSGSLETDENFIQIPVALNYKFFKYEQNTIFSTLGAGLSLAIFPVTKEDNMNITLYDNTLQNQIGERNLSYQYNKNTFFLLAGIGMETQLEANQKLVTSINFTLGKHLYEMNYYESLPTPIEERFSYLNGALEVGITYFFN